MPWISVLLVLASLAAATSPNLSRSVRFYLYCQVITTVLVDAALALVGWQSPYYTAIYVLGSLACRLTSWWVIDALGSHWLERLIALSFASGTAWLAFRHMDGVLGLEPWVILPEGFLLLFMGMTLGFQAPFSKDRRILVPLAILWMLLGVFDFGILMHKSEIWARITDFGSYFLAITVFSFIAFTTRLPKGHCSSLAHQSR